MHFQSIKRAAFGGAVVLGAVNAAQADALPTPAMTGPLAANASPTVFDAGPLGNIDVTGAASGLALVETHHSAQSGDNTTNVDLSNAQLFIQKTDGLVQFFAELGAYSIPNVGAPYVRATTQTTNSFGILPVAYLKIVPSDSFNIEAGKLPTLIGAEYAFTFENLNIERGLLWYQEPSISQGVQANYTSGPISASFSVNDGFYSNRYNSLSGSLAYAFSSADSLTAAAAGNLGHTYYPSPATAPVGDLTLEYQNNGSIYNLIWTHTSGPWTITPYVQYSSIPKVQSVPSSSTWGAAVLANYAFDSNWSLGGRAEYMGASGSSFIELYGPGSKAWSLTVTPTYQYKIFFARAEASYVGIGHATYGFGTGGSATTQLRALFEAGILF